MFLSLLSYLPENKGLLNEAFRDNYRKNYKKWIREIEIRFSKSKRRLKNRRVFDDFVFDMLDRELSDIPNTEEIKREIAELLWHSYNANGCHKKIIKISNRKHNDIEYDDYIEDEEELPLEKFKKGDLVKLNDGSSEEKLIVYSCNNGKYWVTDSENKGWFVDMKNLQKVTSEDEEIDLPIPHEIKTRAKFAARYDFDKHKINSTLNPYLKGTKRYKYWEQCYNTYIKKLQQEHDV